LGWEPVSMIKPLRMKVNFEDTLTPFLHPRGITFWQSEVSLRCESRFCES